MVQALLKKSVLLVPWRWRGTIKQLPLIAPLQRWLLAKFLEHREFVHTVDEGPARGLKYPITLPQDKGIWTGTYELEFATRVATATKRGESALDIGGWRGFFGGVMALAGASQVCIFEPMPANCAQIRKLIELNPNLPVSLFEAAIGEKTGQLEFEIQPETSMGKLALSPFQQEIKGNTRMEVQVICLDDLLANGRITSPGVIKVDVEGAEACVLRGARQLLRTHKPKLFLEIHSRNLARGCQAILLECGYEILVVETRRPPDFVSEPAVCHFEATPGIGVS